MSRDLGTCLVIGGGGFLGSALVRLLRAQGVRVRVLGRHVYEPLAELGAECVRGDIRRPSDVSGACEGCDTVFNTAAVCDVVPDRQLYYDVNVSGCENVIAACRERHVHRFVFTSSPSVVMGAGDIVDGDESLPYQKRYLSPYPETKALAERMVLAANGDGLLTCALRPHLLWGAGDPHILPVMLRMADSGRLRRIGNGRNRVSITHVGNAAHAHILAAEELCGEARCAGKAYFVNDEAPVNLWQWISDLLVSLGRPPVTRSVPWPLAHAVAWSCELLARVFPFRTDFTRFVTDSMARTHTFRYDAAARDFGYAPIVPPEQGLEALVNAHTMRNT